MKPLISLLLSLVFAVTLLAQKEDVTVETSFPTTLLRAEQLPLPDYPEIAKNAGLRGRVSIDITLDNAGWVLTTEYPKGPYPVCQSVTEPAVTALRESATAAARKARFRSINGQAASGIRGRITYNFGADSDIGITVYGIRLDGITAQGSSDLGARIIAPGETYSKKSTDTSAQPRIVSGGVLNGKALALPKPAYPAAAKAVRASGSVGVHVLILEDGSVYSGTAISGHPLLRASSEVAACGSKFQSTLLEGNPVKVSGVITYNYVP